MTSVKFGMTQKRVNSLSVAFRSGSVTLDCRLKEPCGRNEPVFIVQGLDNAHRWNYVYWKGAYYWIDEVVYQTNDIKEVHCHLDVLATFRGDIEASYAYAVYADKAHRCTYKDDERFGPDRKLQWTAGQGPTGSIDMGLDQSNGCYILTTQCSGSYSLSLGGAGDAGIGVYAMTASGLTHVFQAFDGAVMTDINDWGFNGTNVQDFLNNWARRILTGGQQALDNVRSLVYVPIPYSVFTAQFGTQNYITLGPYSFTFTSGDTVSRIQAKWTKTGNAVVSLGRPLPNLANTWLNSPKYCSIKLNHPCGVEDINDPSLLETNQLYLWWSLNCSSGEYAIRVTSENSKDSDTLSVISGTVGIDVLNMMMPVNSHPDWHWLEALTTPTQALSQLGIWSQGTAQPKTGSSSIASGYASLNLLTAGKEVFYDVEYYQPSIFEANDSIEYNAYCDEFGYPCGHYIKIGDNDGYIQCANASVGNGTSGIAGATEEDIKAINEFLNSGIYVEP